MQSLLFYIVKAIVYSGIFFGYYCLALRNKRFHRYSRFYLLASVAASLAMPLLRLQWWELGGSGSQAIQLLNVQIVEGFEDPANASASLLSAQTFILLAYVFIAACLLASFVSGVVKLRRLQEVYPSQKMDDILFINTDLDAAPFSFFNNLFWKNTIDPGSESGRHIFHHELTHIRQKHSWDKLFLRTVSLMVWVNPFYWLMQKELSLIHEFIADEAAVGNNNTEAFARMLLQSKGVSPVFSPAQSFFYSPIKRRLHMLTTSSNTPYSYARRLLVLPLLCLTIVLFAFRLQDGTSVAVAHVNSSFTLLLDAGHGGTDEGAVTAEGIREKDLTLALAKQIQKLSGRYGINVVMTRSSDETLDLVSRLKPAGTAKPDAFVSLHWQATTEPKTEKKGIEVFVARNESATSVDSRVLGSSLVQALQPHFTTTPYLQQRKEKGIYVLDQNPYPAVLIECGYLNNATEQQQVSSSDGMEKMANDILQGIVVFANRGGTSSAASVADTTKPAPLYMVDGKEMTPGHAAAIDASSIASVNVIKDDAAIRQYGNKARNGVVIITLKKSVTVSPLYLVNGKEMSKEELDKIKPEMISSVSVWKGDEAIRKWGEKGENGVIEVQLKPAS